MSIRISRIGNAAYIAIRVVIEQLSLSPRLLERGYVPRNFDKKENSSVYLKPFKTKLMVLLMFLLLPALMQCTSETADKQTERVASKPSAHARAFEEVAPEGVDFPPGFENRKWVDILSTAKGQTVNWYMWGGSQDTNNWVNGYVTTQVSERYGITLNVVFSEILDSISHVRDEHAAGRHANGTVDLIWINGENFQTMRNENLLYGHWSRYLPNSIFVNWNDETISKDFGRSIDGYESPYGKAQIVMVYDKAKVGSPPTTINRLIEWIKANPGKFTYPALPDFTGSAFVRHVCYWAAEGYEVFLTEFNQDAYEKYLPGCYQTLNEIEPFLWAQGKTYPQSSTDLEELFKAGEVYFDIDYQISNASERVEQGVYPPMTRTFVFESGTLGNTHYVAIPYNSPHKAAAMVVANFLLSPDAQLDKISGWGDTPALDPLLLSVEWRQRFIDNPRGVATLPAGVLAEHRLPEPLPEWLEAIEQGWEKNVLNKQENH